MGLIRALVRHGLAQASAKLGRCSYCMGMSLTGALVGWAALAAVLLNWPQFPFVNVLAVGPAAFAALWVLHIVAYAGRVVAAQRHTPQDAIPATGSVMTRRRMATVFAASVGFAAVASAIVPLRALANNGKGCGETACGGYNRTTNQWVQTGPCCPNKKCVPPPCNPILLPNNCIFMICK